MGVLDFLFEGKPPASVTTYGTSTANLPQWMSDYTQGLIARANTVSAQPYQPYSGPRIAGFTPDQSKAFQLTEGNVGSYKPDFNQAGALTQAAGGTDVTGAAQPYLDQAGKTLPGNIDAYMNPYVGNVIGRAELEANRNFNENLMPTLDNKFTSSGQYGSSAHEREADRAARDLTEGLQSTSLGALSTAYNTAGTQFQNDQARQANLANTAGNLASEQGNLQLNAGKQFGALGQATQAAGLTDASALDAVGAEQKAQNQSNLDLAHQDFVDQRDYPKNQVDWMSSVIRGVPAPVSTQTSSTGPASAYGPSGLSQLASVATAGKGLYDLFGGGDTSSKSTLDYVTPSNTSYENPYKKGGRIQRRSGALQFASAR